MRIAKLLAQNVKIGAVQHELEPVTIFVGGSESGKTACMDALLLALLSYHPRLGKRASDSMKLAAGVQMQVAIETDDGRKLSRQWFRNGEKVETKTPRDELKLTFPSFLFSVQDYFTLTARERLALIFSLCSMGDYDHQSEIMLQLRGMRIENGTKATGAALTELLATVQTHSEQCDQEGLGLQEWLSLLLDLLTNQLKDARGLDRSFAGAAESDVHIRAADGKLQQPESVESLLPPARERLKVLDVEAQGIQDKKQERDKAKKRLAAIKEELAKLPASVEQVATISQERLKELREGVAGMEQKLETELRLRLKEHRQLHSSAQSKLETAVRDLQELKVEIAEAAEHDACPYCKSKSKGWRKHLESAHKKASDSLKSEIYKQQTTADGLTKELAALVNEEADFVNALREIKAELEKAVDFINLNAKAAAAGATCSKLEGEQKALLDSLPPEPLPSYLMALELKLKGARDDVSGLEQKQKQWLAHKAGQVQAAKALEQRERAEARVLVTKQALESVTEAQAKLVADSVAALMEKANIFLSGILPGELIYSEGNFGYYTPEGGWVSLETFSGTRKALTLIGLSVALSGQSPFRLVMLDELGIVSVGIRRQIVARMIELVRDGVIDQFVGADSQFEAWDEDLPGVHIIKV